MYVTPSRVQRNWSVNQNFRLTPTHVRRININTKNHLSRVKYDKEDVFDEGRKTRVYENHDLRVLRVDRSGGTGGSKTVDCSEQGLLKVRVRGKEETRRKSPTGTQNPWSVWESGVLG